MQNFDTYLLLIELCCFVSGAWKNVSILCLEVLGRLLQQKVENGMGSPDWYVPMFSFHLRRLLWIMHSPGHAGLKGNDRTDRPAGKATLTMALRLGRSEVLWNLNLRAQSQGHHTIDRLKDRDVKGGSAR